MNMPDEVKAYFEQGSRHAVKLLIEKPSSIVVTYDDGEIRKKDMTEEMTGVMASLREERVFNTAHLKENSSIAWDTPYGEIDIDQDNLYIYGEKVNPPYNPMD